MPNDVSAVTLVGTEYQDVAHLNYTSIFVTEGVAFGQKDVGSGYYMSIDPSILVENDLGEGAEVERTLYSSGSKLFVADNGNGEIRETYYEIDGDLWELAAIIRSNRWQDAADADVYDEAATGDYVRLESPYQDDDDLLIPALKFEQLLDSRDILQLWPVWESAHR